MEPFKNRLSLEVFDKFSSLLKQKQDSFDKEGFLNRIFDKDWEDKELKQRIRHASTILHEFLTKDFVKDSNLLISLRQDIFDFDVEDRDLAFNFIPDYIAVFGLDHLEQSIKCFEQLTAMSTCEFAVRPFFVKYEKQMIAAFLAFAKHPDQHVRRLASEGCRPRLPWGMALKSFKNDPTPILPILETLKEDESDYVRLSVSNNLNDISKDHPSLFKKLMKLWQLTGAVPSRLIKHASRTLLKAGDPEVMAFFGYDIKGLKLSNFKLLTPIVKVGESLEFQFDIVNNKKVEKLIRVEYAIFFLLKNGNYGKKVFKVSEKDYRPSSTTTITRKQSFKIVTTRHYNIGKHYVAPIINGIIQEKYAFDLTR